MDLKKLVKDFSQNTFSNEDDIKLHFFSEIVKPILQEINPTLINAFKSENNLKAGGRADATFINIPFEYKSYKYFDMPNNKGINEALHGRNNSDHGLYDYLLSGADIHEKDTAEEIIAKLTKSIGVGFDGKSFIFARFVESSKREIIDTSKVKLFLPEKLNLRFIYEVKPIETGIKKLALIFKQTEKITMNKQTLCAVFNTKNQYVRESIIEIYKAADMNINNIDYVNNRVRTLYKEWDKIFGKMYGSDEEATDFTEASSKIREAYGLDDIPDIDSKLYLFSLQTFFNIFLKLLVYSFLAQLIDPMFVQKKDLDKKGIQDLFDGISTDSSNIVNNFFEAHFLEWFIYTADEFGVDIVNKTLEMIDKFDLSTFVLRPENVQDVLQEVYMELIPAKMRHLMGEYFSPDWIVEHALDMVEYNGDINKKLIDPCAGSGPFLTQAIKRIIETQNGVISRADIDTITHNIVGFDINPISVVSAKANYILILFSAYYEHFDEDFGKPVSIPIFIADSILAPVVYSEQNADTLILDTTVGKIEIPKFETYDKGAEFLGILSKYIDDRVLSSKYDSFINYVLGKELIKEKDVTIVKRLFDRLCQLHKGAQDSFWPIIFRNSFAPIMQTDKYDYVVGNPPWIAWKGMSKSYREGTLEVWQSYGIFEKNAYDKKTTHDDFGMAVTYVAIDQYLKDNGKMVFLLPASFLKATKGGEGFRKFEIIRNNQSAPFKVDAVHDFSDVSLFTIPTVAIKFIKGHKMEYPMSSYRFYRQVGRKSKIDSHRTWNQVESILEFEDVCAQPVDMSDLQSAWLTLKSMKFANSVLDISKKRYYKGRKGIEPAGAKGVYILKKPTKAETKEGHVNIINDMSRQRRQDVKDKGEHKGCIEETYIYPMLGGRNIAKWKVKSNEYMLVPHSAKYKYGIPEDILAKESPDTYDWLLYFHNELLATRIQNGKFFNEALQPFYRLDNVGTYTYSPYKVLWKEQTGSMSAVVVGSYLESIPDADEKLFDEDKPIVVDSKVLMLDTYDKLEAHYVCGIINAPSIIEVVDGYAISTNRGTDVLKYIAIEKFDSSNSLHREIAELSIEIHEEMLTIDKPNGKVKKLEKELDEKVFSLFTSN